MKVVKIAWRLFLFLADPRCYMKTSMLIKETERRLKQPRRTAKKQSTDELVPLDSSMFNMN